MIDTKKINIEKMVDAVFRAQRDTGYKFDLADAYEIARYSARKADLNGKDENYVPILFENELRDHVMRERINEMGRKNLCARSVCTALA